MNLFRITAVYLILNVIAIGYYAKNAYPFQKRLPSDHISIGVEEISRSDTDEYKIEIGITNSSPKTFSIKEFEYYFYLQSNTGWNMMKLDTVVLNDSLNADPSIRPMSKKMIINIVKIPVRASDIYRTYEGDISLIFKYRLQFTAEGKENVFLKFNEEYYWISPGTNKWVHRECM